jgi:death-on-curing protein
MDLQYLDSADILRIYDFLVEDFAKSHDPIAPAGVMDENLLESAVSRQYVSSGSELKYRTSEEVAATLAYGLCNNHCFFNGNKRAALVATLVLLDKNKLSLWGVGKDDLYDFILSTARHAIVAWVYKDGGRPRKGLEGSDAEVFAMADWFARHSAPVKRGEREITFRELKRILNRFGYTLANPLNNSIKVLRLVDGDGPTQTKHIDTIGYPRETGIVPVHTLKRVRERCLLREEDGVDTESFYDQYAVIDAFVNKYRMTLRRLAKL